MIKAITGDYINIHPSTFRMSRPKGLPHFILLVTRIFQKPYIYNAA